MEIYLLRHGDATDRQDGGYTRDEERPLTEAGREEARVAAEALRGLGGAIDLVLTSPLLRAEQTATIAADLLRPAQGLARCAPLAPGGDPEAVVAALVAAAPASALLVGHMPDLGELAGWLVWGLPDAALALRTGGLCRITARPGPGAGNGDLRWLLPPRLLQRLG